MQGGTFQTPSHTHARPSGTGRVPRATDRGQAPPPPVPNNILAVPADTEAVSRGSSWGQTQQPLVPTNTLAIPRDGEAVLRDRQPGSRDAQALNGEVSGQNDGEGEEALLLAGSAVEEEVLESELQALRAARQQFQRASLSQVLIALLQPGPPATVSVTTAKDLSTLDTTMGIYIHLTSALVTIFLS